MPATTLAGAEGRLDAASGKAGAAAQAAIAPSVVQSRARHDQLSAQLQSMLGRLGAGHPDVRRRARAAGRRGSHDRSGRSAASWPPSRLMCGPTRERVDALQRNLGGEQAQIARDAQAQVPLNAMQRDADASRGLLQAVLERIQQTAQQPAIEAPDAHEISLALIPGRPSFPRTGPWMAAAVALGPVLGPAAGLCARDRRQHLPQRRRCPDRCSACHAWH